MHGAFVPELLIAPGVTSSSSIERPAKRTARLVTAVEPEGCHRRLPPPYLAVTTPGATPLSQNRTQAGHRTDKKNFGRARSLRLACLSVGAPAQPNESDRS